MEQITNKIKVALISGYTSHKTRSHLDLKSNKGLFSFLLKLFRIPSRVGEFKDTTPWIEHILYALLKRNDVELHLIAPQIRLKGKVQDFVMEGVHYYYYSTEFSSFLRKLNRYGLWKKLQTNGRYVKKLVDTINPDIVVLSGAENPPSSIPVLYIDNYPVYVMCQTVYSDPLRKDSGKYNKLIWDMEREILEKKRYIGVYSILHYHLVKDINPKSFVFDFQYPRKGLPEIEDVPKTIDFINCAFELSDGKGAHDCIRALAIVKQQYPNVRLDLTGGIADKTKQVLLSLVKELNLEDNVSFTPFFEVREDMFRHMKTSRFAVLPIKYDVISGTVYEAMRYGLPVVTNIRPGTLKVNEKSECLLLAEVGNVEMLAEKMVELMSNQEKAEQLRKNSLAFMEEMNSREDHAGERLVQDFKAIVNHYQNGTLIPEDLLCNENSFNNNIQ